MIHIRMATVSHPCKARLPSGQLLLTNGLDFFLIFLSHIPLTVFSIYFMCFCIFLLETLPLYFSKSVNAASEELIMLEFGLILGVMITVADFVEIIHIELPDKRLISIMPEMLRKDVHLEIFDILNDK